MAAAFRLALEGRAFPPQRRGQQQAGQRSNGRISAEQSSDVVETDAEAAREEEAPEPNADAANCGLPDPMHAQTSADALKGVLKSTNQADSVQPSPRQSGCRAAQQTRAFVPWEQLCATQPGKWALRHDHHFNSEHKRRSVEISSCVQKLG
jgi:hypothetical protein